VSQGKAGITYHFLVAGDGTIYWTQTLEAITDQTLQAAANQTGVGVALAGNFTDVAPPATQLDAAARLIAWLLDQRRLNPEAIIGRSEVDTTIFSPGKQWQGGVRYRDTLLAAVGDYLSSQIVPT
jgi:cytosine/adenosine deaminase-related metal-dependent hydrolase